MRNNIIKDLIKILVSVILFDSQYALAVSVFFFACQIRFARSNHSTKRNIFSVGSNSHSEASGFLVSGHFPRNQGGSSLSTHAWYFFTINREWQASCQYSIVKYQKAPELWIRDWRWFGTILPRTRTHSGFVMESVWTTAATKRRK